MAEDGTRTGWRRRRELRLLVASLIVFAALLGPLLAPYPPDATDLSHQLQPPSREHLLGTDFYGRDLLTRLLYGTRATLGVAAIAVAVSLVFGVLAGLAAGMMNGWAGQAWVGVFDLMLAFPPLLLALLIVAVLGPGLTALAAAVGIAGIPAYGRVVRSLTLTLRSAAFVEAARSLGAKPLGIVRRHILRNASPPVLALVPVDFGRAIISVAALGYLGLGAPPPQAEWGLMLYEGRGYLSNAPWASFAPGLAITLTVLLVTLLGDALSE
jgi:peptide/nickel transport system permease protein